MNATRLSPRDPELDRCYSPLGIADLVLGKLGPTLDRRGKPVDMKSNAALQFFLPAAAAQSRHADEASAAREASSAVKMLSFYVRGTDLRRATPGWRPGRKSEVLYLLVATQCGIWVKS